MSETDCTAVLAQVPFFERLDADELDAVSRCVVRRQVGAGETIIEEGVAGESLHVILSGKVRVEKVRVQKRHLKPGRRGARTGGILEQEAFFDLSNVMLVDPKDNQPSRIRVEERDGRRVRVFTRSGDAVPEPPRA